MTPPSEGADSLRDAYVDLVKRSVSNYLYLGENTGLSEFNAVAHYDRQKSRWAVGDLSRPTTLLDKGQLDLIEKSVLDLEQRGVPGDYIEAGVWRGGAVILMRALMKAYDIRDRQIIAADSFSGIPANTQFRHDPVDLWEDRWAASLDEVRANIARFGLLDDRIEFLEGFFADTLPTLDDRQFALIRLDSDSHDSVMASLVHLYPRLTNGGIIIVDDWHLPGCRIAVDAYRAQNGITDEMTADSGNGFWVKS
jgi:O-methyltransferase